MRGRSPTDEAALGRSRRGAPGARFLVAASVVAARLTRDLVSFALPQRCPGCAAVVEGGRLMCEPCEERIPRLSMAVCARCLARGREPVGCELHPGFAVWPAWVYEERAARVVHALKFEGRRGVAGRLGVDLARVVPAAPRPDLVLEVPLHPARRRERGYNQAGLLADSLAAEISTPRLAGALERVRPTRPQARLDSATRRSNVAGAFRIRRPHWLRGRNVAIVDDVITTGATFEACLEVLRGAGVNAWGVALAWAQ